ncbi:MAG: magnesium transporter [Verrucomicrobia bacterium]|nr:magnesium transporter [Verrucomicrobiota bacterium]
MSEPSALLPLLARYFETDLPGATRQLEAMSESDAIEVLQSLPPATAARAIRQLQVGFAAAVLGGAEAHLFEAVAGELDAPLAAAIFMHLSGEARERLLEHLPDRLKRAVQEQLTFPENSVGRLMSTEFLAFRENLTVGETIERIRRLAQKRYPASYAYVVDPQERLVGVVNMRDLMLAQPDARLGAVMRSDVFALYCFLDREDAANEMSRRRYFAAPVVDHENRILGIIKGEQLMQGIQEEGAEDLQIMFGAGRDERAFSSLGYSLKMRLPWLHVNLATAFLAAGVVALFEGMIAKLTVLAVFLPVVAGQGGNAGAQSLAVVMRALVMREIPSGKILKLIAKETWLATISGAVFGSLTALIAWLWSGNPWLGLVAGLGMLVNLVCAGLAGASIPVLMHRLGLDPAQCSSIILTTVTDVVGFFAFLGFAVVFQHYLL